MGIYLFLINPKHRTDAAKISNYAAGKWKHLENYFFNVITQFYRVMGSDSE